MKPALGILATFLILSISFSGCKKCITCTEQTSGYSKDYCGTPAKVRSFEQELKEAGSLVGQKWTCVDN